MISDTGWRCHVHPRKLAQTDSGRIHIRLTPKLPLGIAQFPKICFVIGNEAELGEESPSYGLRTKSELRRFDDSVWRFFSWRELSHGRSLKCDHVPGVG